MLEFTFEIPSKGEYKENGSCFHAILEPAPSIDHVKSILLILKGIIKSILQKNQAEVIQKEFGENIDIHLEIDIDSADEFIDNIKELSDGNAQIIVVG